MRNTIVFGRTKLKTVFNAMKLMGFGAVPILVSIVLESMVYEAFLPHIHTRLKKTRVWPQNQVTGTWPILKLSIDSLSQHYSNRMDG